MHKKLIEFLPPEISAIEEFKQITSTEDIELEQLEQGKQKILYENFIDTATEDGVRFLEALFKIRADPFSESLGMRKLRLKNRKMDKMPITHRALEQKLRVLFGEDSYKINVDNNKYTLKVEVNTFDWNAFNEITDNFRYIIPCNMILNSRLAQKINTKLHVGACMTAGEEIIVYPWMTKDVTSKGKINIAIGSNTGVENIIIYPKKEMI